MTLPTQEAAESLSSSTPEAGHRERPLPGIALLLRRARWIVASALLGAVVGFTVSELRSPTYESTIILTVTSTDPQDSVASLARTAQALARLATAPGIVSDPLRDAGFAEAARDPRQFLNLEAAPDAPLIHLSARADDPDTARAIAQTAADSLTSVHLGDARAVPATVPQIPEEPTTPTWFLISAGTSVGAALSLVFATTVPLGTSGAPRARGSSAVRSSVQSATARLSHRSLPARQHAAKHAAGKTAQKRGTKEDRPTE
jgi:hypothetical protein